MFEANALIAHLNPPSASDLFNAHSAWRPWAIGAAAFKGDGLFRLTAGQGLVGSHEGLPAKRFDRQGDQQGRSRRRTRQSSTGSCLQRAVDGEWRCLGLPRFNNPCEVTVPRYQARVLVNLRPSVLDPAGEATRSAASRLGVDGVSKLRIGKAVELELDAPDEQEARRRLELLSDRLLANPVIENWTLELQQA